jgi:hypothetical protein
LCTQVFDTLGRMIPPQFGWPFLMWLKSATEKAWSRVEARTLADYEDAGVGGCDWQRGTHWTGPLSDGEIDTIEARFAIRFPPDHRMFLQVLHATEPLQSGARFVDSERMKSIERPGFYHWLRDDAAIRAAFTNVTDGLVFDVEHNQLWRDSWGARPPTPEQRRTHVAELVARAPKLLPIIGHRYVLAEGPTLVLSVHQSDIIVYGGDLRAFLLSELYQLLDIPDDPSWQNADTSTIPFWGELMS